MKSPRTSCEIKIDTSGVELAKQLTWQCTPESFVQMARVCFGLPIDGPPPMWHLLELMLILKEHGIE